MPPRKLPVRQPVRVEPEIAADDIKNGAEHRQDRQSRWGIGASSDGAPTPGTTPTFTASVVRSDAAAIVDDRVFQGPGGTPMDGSALYWRYREIQTAAGVRGLRFHDLRRTFGTQAIASGAHEQIG